jgi:hypothetical protein
MKAMALLCLQQWRIDQLLATLDEEADHAHSVALVVEIVEHVMAHLAMKKNVVYLAVDDTQASALVASWQGNAAARRGLKLLVQAAAHPEVCRARARALRATLDAHAQHDEALVLALEATLSGDEADRLGGEAERYYAACIYAHRCMPGERTLVAKAS